MLINARNSLDQQHSTEEHISLLHFALPNINFHSNGYIRLILNFRSVLSFLTLKTFDPSTEVSSPIGPGGLGPLQFCGVLLSKSILAPPHFLTTQGSIAVEPFLKPWLHPWSKKIPLQRGYIFCKFWKKFDFNRNLSTKNSAGNTTDSGLVFQLPTSCRRGRKNSIANAQGLRKCGSSYTHTFFS